MRIQKAHLERYCLKNSFFPENLFPAAFAVLGHAPLAEFLLSAHDHRKGACQSIQTTVMTHLTKQQGALY